MKRALSDEDSATDSTLDCAGQWHSLADMGFPLYEATPDGRVRHWRTYREPKRTMRSGRSYIMLQQHGTQRRVRATHIITHVCGKPTRAPEPPPAPAPIEWRPLAPYGYSGYEMTFAGQVRNATSGELEVVLRRRVRLVVCGRKMTVDVRHLRCLVFGMGPSAVAPAD